jgi:hypothetical protein
VLRILYYSHPNTLTVLYIVSHAVSYYRERGIAATHEQVPDALDGASTSNAYWTPHCSSCNESVVSETKDIAAIATETPPVPVVPHTAEVLHAQNNSLSFGDEKSESEQLCLDPAIENQNASGELGVYDSSYPTHESIYSHNTEAKSLQLCSNEREQLLSAKPKSKAEKVSQTQVEVYPVKELNETEGPVNKKRTNKQFLELIQQCVSGDNEELEDGKTLHPIPPKEAPYCLKGSPSACYRSRTSPQKYIQYNDPDSEETNTTTSYDLQKNPYHPTPNGSLSDFEGNKHRKSRRIREEQPNDWQNCTIS